MNEEQAQQTAELVRELITDNAAITVRYNALRRRWYVNVHAPGSFLIELRTAQDYGRIVHLFSRIGEMVG